jgi:hypothetical protein
MADGSLVRRKTQPIRAIREDGSEEPSYVNDFLAE